MNYLKIYIILSVLFLSLFADDSLEKVNLQLQWKNQFEFAGFYAAKEKGFYKEAGLDVDFIEFNSKNIVDEVLNDHAQYGLTYSTLIADYMQGKPIVFLANFFKQSPSVLVTRKNIHTPKDLKNKKIMGLLDSTHKQIFLEMLKKFNITKDDFINVPRKFSVKSFVNHKVDAIAVFTTNEIYTLDKLGIQYNILDPAAFGTKFYDLNLFCTKSELENHPKRVEKFRNASIKGWEYALKHKDEIVDLILKKYNTQNKSKEALLYEANQIEYLMLANIYPIGSIDLERVKMISDSFAQSLNMQKISRDKLTHFIYKDTTGSFQLNMKQKEYLQHKKLLKMCVDPNWMPLEKIENGKHIGIAADFIHIVSQKIGVPIQLVETKSWTESLNKAKQRKCDILALAAKTHKREKYLNFTTPYITTPIVIATKRGIPFIDNLNSIKGKALGVVKNYSIEELLKTKYPDINLVELDSVQKGLAYVDQEKIFGFLDNSIVINNEIQKSNMNSIAITGQFQESYKLSIASRNDEPILNEILEKVLISIDDKTRDQIFNKWDNIKYKLQVDYNLIAQILFFGMILLSIILYWNLKLKDEIKSKELAQKKLRESEEKFRTLFDIAPILLDSFDEEGKVVLWNKECEKVFGWTKEEIQKQSDPLSLFYPDPKDKQRVLDSFNHKVYDRFEQWHPKTKSGKTIITMWANIKLPNDENINVGYDITQQHENKLAIQEKAKQLKSAKQQLEELNNTLEEKIKEEIKKNTKSQMMLMHQSKLAQMGEMIENIAHQWRQPLAQINSSVLLIDTFLEKNNFHDETVEDKLLEIESLTAYMSKTIDDFKNFFHPNKQKVHFKVEKAIQKSYDILKGTLRANNIEIILNVPKEIQCENYLYELQQVIVTILNNAIDALVIMEIKSPKIIVEVKELQDNISIAIEDNALGIDEKILDKIFEPYFTTKYKSQGTGLGLYMAKMITESGLSGSLEVINKKEGACFTILIPKGEQSVC